MSLCLPLSNLYCLIKRSVLLNVNKQLRKHQEPLTKAKRQASWFSSSEIKISCYTELQAYITPPIYNKFTSSLTQRRHESAKFFLG